MTRVSYSPKHKSTFIRKAWSWLSSNIQKAYNYVRGNRQNHFSKSIKNLQKIKIAEYRKQIRQKLANKSYLKSKTQIERRFKEYLKNRLAKDKQDQFSCPICLEAVIFPSSTPCGHTFCYRCLQDSLIFAVNCPVCRTQIRGIQIVPCLILEQLMNKKSPHILSETHLENYQIRHKQFQKWRSQRCLNEKLLKVGESIDVRDTQYIWCKAEIKQVFYSNGQPSSVLIHYKGWNKIYDEILDVKSSRLAPSMFFCSRNDIPRYSLRQEDENTRGTVIIGQPQSRDQIRPIQPIQRDFIIEGMHNFFRNQIAQPLVQIPQPLVHIQNADNQIEFNNIFQLNNLAIQIQENEQLINEQQQQVEQNEENSINISVNLPVGELIELNSSSNSSSGSSSSSAVQYLVVESQIQQESPQENN